MKIAGIDPGNKGAISIVEFQGPKIVGIQILRFNKLDILTTKGRKEIIMFLLANNVDRVYIERVNPFKAGRKAWKVLGQWYGVLLTACTASCHEPVLVMANKWQGDLNCRSGGDKNVTKRKAELIYERALKKAGLKINHDIADSLLIAYYGHKDHKNARNLARIKRARPSRRSVKTPW